MEPLVALVRRWAVDWLGRGDPSVCEEILADGYALSIGGHRLEGRDAYVAATVEGLLERWPGVGLTIHELICNGDRAAARLTEHGPDARSGQPASWRVVTLFAWDGERLTEGWAEEDYHARRRQLKSGSCDPIEPPAPAPWSTEAEPADPAAEEVLRTWLAAGDLSAAALDDGRDADLDFEPSDAHVDDLFSAGDRVAFHGALHGADAPLHLAGIVTVAEGEVVGGHVIRDRLGLQRARAA